MKNPASQSPPGATRRPDYGFMPVADALAADWTGYHLSQKADGVCVRREWNGAAVWGDSLPDGRLMVWEIDTFRGQDVRAWDWPARDAALAELFRDLNPKLNWERVGECRIKNEECRSGAPGFQDSKIGNRQSAIGNFLREMIAFAEENHTPDVAVAKPISAGFGLGLIKIKLVQTYDVTVTDADGASLSVAIAYEGRPAGRVPVRNLVVRDNLRAGDCIEIGGTLLPSGKFREPRFMRTRPDKAMAKE